MATRPARGKSAGARFAGYRYIWDGHKFRSLPIKPWKWEPGQNNRGLPRIPRDATPFPYPAVARSLSPFFAFLRLLCPAASPRAFSYDPLAIFPLSRIARFLFFNPPSSLPPTQRERRRLEKSKRRGPHCPCERKICNLAAQY